MVIDVRSLSSCSGPHRAAGRRRQRSVSAVAASLGVEALLPCCPFSWLLVLSRQLRFEQDVTLDSLQEVSLRRRRAELGINVLCVELEHIVVYRTRTRARSRVGYAAEAAAPLHGAACNGLVAGHLLWQGARMGQQPVEHREYLCRQDRR